MSRVETEVEWVTPVLSRIEILANFGGILDREQALALRTIIKAQAERNDALWMVVESQRRLAELERQFRREIYKMIALVAFFAFMTWLFS